MPHSTLWEGLLREMMANTGIVFVCFFSSLALLVAVAAYILDSRWRRRRLERWAEQENLAVLSAEERSYSQGPFFTGNMGYVYRITVTDRTGNNRSGWIRFRPLTWGTGPNAISVRWDSQSSAAANDKTLQGSADQTQHHRP